MGMSAKLAINRVGTVTLQADGQVDASGWGFGTPALPEGATVDMEPSAGGLAGWTAYELHAIAHGIPCDCEVAQSVRP